MFKILLSLLVVSQVACAKEMMIPARDGVPTYHIDIPEGWAFELNSKNLGDTTEPLATATKGNIVVTVHNFPSDSILLRIPPLAQITRWKKQFISIDEQSMTITPTAWSGFNGVRFEASGKQNDKAVTVIAWSLLIAPQYYHQLNAQQRADVTIKALGPPPEMKEERMSLLTIAQSLELLEGIDLQ